MRAPFQPLCPCKYPYRWHVAYDGSKGKGVVRVDRYTQATPDRQEPEAEAERGVHTFSHDVPALSWVAVYLHEHCDKK
jgi:hypothetical protein